MAAGQAACSAADRVQAAALSTSAELDTPRDAVIYVEPNPTAAAPHPHAAVAAARRQGASIPVQQPGTQSHGLQISRQPELVAAAAAASAAASEAASQQSQSGKKVQKRKVALFLAYVGAGYSVSSGSIRQL